jgi:hypothetical protein
MKITTDRDAFEKQQKRVIEEIARDVKDHLEKIGAGTNQKLVEGIVFSICAIFDGSRQMELDGMLVHPYLTFVNDEEGEELLEGGGSWMHEISHRIVRKTFEGHTA